VRSVLPGAALTPAPSKPSTTLVGTNGALGVNAMTKLCEPKFGGAPCDRNRRIGRAHQRIYRGVCGLVDKARRHRGHRRNRTATSC
jgi:hypothetical protein